MKGFARALRCLGRYIWREKLLYGVILGFAAAVTACALMFPVEKPDSPRPADGAAISADGAAISADEQAADEEEWMLARLIPIGAILIMALIFPKLADNPDIPKRGMPKRHGDLRDR